MQLMWLLEAQKAQQELHEVFALPQLLLMKYLQTVL
jgi:hypothetical protein